MKPSWLILLLAAGTALAHDHVEVGEDPADPARLGLDGPGYQLAMYVPPGEPFSGYAPLFPGGWHACELTFSTDVNALNPAIGADPRFELVSVKGPTNGVFCFWEADALTPTWTRPVGWTNSPGNTATFAVVVGGDGHIHGRIFTMNRPGTYTVTFRVVDQAGTYAASLNRTISFEAQLPPPLALSIQGGDAVLSFTSRLNLDYVLQSCGDLGSGIWTTEATIGGDGTAKTRALPLLGRACMHYRLVEY